MPNYRESDEGDAGGFRSLIELADRLPEYVVKLPIKVQEIIELTRKDMTSEQIGIRVEMTDTAVRKARQRARKWLEQIDDGEFLSFGGVLALFSLKSLLPQKSCVAATHAHAGVVMPLTGVITAVAACVGVFTLASVTDPPLPMEVATTRATTMPAAVHRDHSPIRQSAVGAGTPVQTMVTRTGRLGSTSRLSVGNAVPASSGASVSARGHVELSINPAGGQQDAHEVAGASPVGKVATGGGRRATGPMTAWTVCSEQNVGACEEAPRISVSTSTP